MILGLSHRLHNVQQNLKNLFLASQDALEVMYVSESVSEGTDRDFTDVTLVSEDTYQRLY